MVRYPAKDAPKEKTPGFRVEARRFFIAGVRPRLDLFLAQQLIANPRKQPPSFVPRLVLAVAWLRGVNAVPLVLASLRLAARRVVGLHVLARANLTADRGRALHVARIAQHSLRPLQLQEFNLNLLARTHACEDLDRILKTVQRAAIERDNVVAGFQADLSGRSARCDRNNHRSVLHPRIKRHAEQGSACLVAHIELQVRCRLIINDVNSLLAISAIDDHGDTLAAMKANELDEFIVAANRASGDRNDHVALPNTARIEQAIGLYGRDDDASIVDSAKLNANADVEVRIIAPIVATILIVSVLVIAHLVIARLVAAILLSAGIRLALIVSRRLIGLRLAARTLRLIIVRTSRRLAAGPG